MKIQAAPIPIGRLMIRLRGIADNTHISGRVLVFDAWPRDNEGLRKSYTLGIPWQDHTFHELAELAAAAVVKEPAP